MEHFLIWILPNHEESKAVEDLTVNWDKVVIWDGVLAKEIELKNESFSVKNVV